MPNRRTIQFKVGNQTNLLPHHPGSDRAVTLNGMACLALDFAISSKAVQKTTNPSIGIGKSPPFSRVCLPRSGGVCGRRRRVRRCQGVPASQLHGDPSRARAIGTHGATNMRQGTRGHICTRGTFKGSVIWGVASSAFHTVLYCMFRSRHEPMFFFSMLPCLHVRPSVHLRGDKLRRGATGISVCLTVFRSSFFFTGGRVFG
jgi:hypothetical protein